jgi:ABC-type Fe3+/spermidine/putrescine transport system ATPase subunit
MDNSREAKDMSESHCEFRAIAKTYGGRPVLSDVSFTVSAGEHLAILGRSGSGKSTLLRLLAGLEAPSSGQVLLDGHVASHPRTVVISPHRRSVGMVFQDLALWPHLSVKENILLGLSGAQLTHREAQRRAHEALALCAIESLTDRRPGKLSGGEQQRVALARAIAVQPTYLLLDEPFSGLDLITKTTLLKEISGLATNQRFTLILVSHDPFEVTALCPSVLVLENGHVEEVGSLERLLHTPRSMMLRVFRSHLREPEPYTGPK